MVLVNFLGGEKLAKICSKSVRRTQAELRSSLLIQYTIARAAIVNQLNIYEDDLGRMFVRRTPPSLAPVKFLGAEELAIICSKSVRRTQTQLHTSLLLQYTIAGAAVLN